MSRGLALCVSVCLMAVISLATLNPSTGVIEVPLESATGTLSFIIDNNRRAFTEGFLNCAASSEATLSTVVSDPAALNVSVRIGSGTGPLSYSQGSEHACDGLINYRYCISVATNFTHSTNGTVALTCTTDSQPTSHNVWEAVFNFHVRPTSGTCEASEVTVFNDSSSNLIPFRIGSLPDRLDISGSSMLESVAIIENESSDIFNVSTPNPNVFFCSEVGTWDSSTTASCVPLTKELLVATPAAQVLSGYFAVNRSILISKLVTTGSAMLAYQLNTTGSTILCKGTVSFANSSGYNGSLAVNTSLLTNGAVLLGAGGAQTTIPILIATTSMQPTTALKAQVVYGASTCVRVASVTATTVTVQSMEGYGPCRAVVSIEGSGLTPLLISVATVGVALNSTATHVISARKWADFSLSTSVSLFVAATGSDSATAWFPALTAITSANLPEAAAAIVRGSKYTAAIYGNGCQVSNVSAAPVPGTTVLLSSLAAPLSVRSTADNTCYLAVTYDGLAMANSFALLTSVPRTATPMHTAVNKSASMSISAVGTVSVSLDGSDSRTVAETESMSLDVSNSGINVTVVTTKVGNNTTAPNTTAPPNTTAAPATPSTTTAVPVTFEPKDDEESGGSKFAKAVIVIVCLGVPILVAFCFRKRIMACIAKFRGKEQSDLNRSNAQAMGGEISVDRPPRDLYGSDDEGHSRPMQPMRSSNAMVPRPGQYSSAAAANTAAAVAAAHVNFLDNNRPAQGARTAEGPPLSPTAPLSPSPNSRVAAVLKPIGKPKATLSDGGNSSSGYPEVPRAKPQGLGLGGAQRINNEAPTSPPTFGSANATVSSPPQAPPAAQAANQQQPGWDVDDFFSNNPAPATSPPEGAPRLVADPFSPHIAVPGPVGSSISQVPWGASTSSVPPGSPQNQQQQPASKPAANSGWGNDDNLFD